MMEERRQRRRHTDKEMENEATELMRVMQQVRTNHLLKSLAIAAFCLFTILGVLAYGIINTNRRAQQNEEVTRAGIICIIEQIAEHRANTVAAEDDFIRRHGFPPPPRPERVIVPEELEDEVQRACKEFIK